MPDLYLVLFKGRGVNIESKLALVENCQCIVGIKEGMFVRFYEQSLFVWRNGYLNRTNSDIESVTRPYMGT